MPRKIRDLIQGPEKSRLYGSRRQGQPSQFIDGNGNRATISGREGDDAKHYQEREVRVKIARSKTNEK